MLESIKSLLWWKAAAIRGLRTASVVALPYIGGATLELIPWLTILSAAGLGFIASILTSLAGIAEVDGAQVSWWYAILERVVKTMVQALAVGIGNSVLFTDVDWSVTVQTALIASLGSLLLGFVTRLPEAELLPSPVQAVVAVTNATATDTSSGTVVTSTDTDV